MHEFPLTSPESVGISSRTLLRMMKKLSGLEYLNSIVILRHGRSVLEAWQAPYRRETPHQLFSLSKSFTSCAIGLAQAEGRLKITDKLVSFFPEYANCITDSRMRDATLEDLLAMRSGHLACATRYMLKQQDFIRAYLASPLDTEPGSRFAYNSGATYMLSAVIRQVTGENVREYLMPRLFEPLRISPGVWESCPRGINFGGWGLSLTTDDLAKFAQLLLQHGKWNGHQLLPADYLAEATRKHSDNSMNENPDWKLGYGYQFWISQHGYRGDGASGQLAIVIEEQDLCIAVTSCLSNMQELLNVFWIELIPHLHDAPLPEDSFALKELRDYAANWAIQPPNPFLKKQPGTQLNAECDGLGEFLGAGYMPAANVDNIVRYVREGTAAGVSRYAIRLDRIGNNIFDSHEINIFAYQQLIRNPELTADDIYAMWAKDHWQGCEKEMTVLSRMGLEAVLKTNFICGNVVFHKFPILPDWKWVAAGGSPGLYHNNVSLHQLRGEWGILADNNAPGRNAIRKEKQEALKRASEGLARVRRLKGILSEREYARTERVWRILNIACKAICAFTESLCSYFDDLENCEPHPKKLKTSVGKAEEIINGLLADTSESLPTMESCCDGAPLPGDDLDRVYLKGLRVLCREMLPQYEAEQKLRAELTDAETLDLILPGSFGDQYRIFRYMHASHSELKNGVPIRYAGNTVFPNGFFEVELKCVPGGRIYITLLKNDVREIKLTINGLTKRTSVPDDGTIVLDAPTNEVTLRMEKSGLHYPAVVAVKSNILTSLATQ